MKRLLFFYFLAAITFNAFGQAASEIAIQNGAQQAKPYVILSKPSSQSLAATGSVQWTGQPGGTYILTVTQAPGATAAFVATVQFESSPDGTTWSAVNASPLVGLPGAGQAVVTSTTAAGMWQIQLPNASSGSATAPIQHFFRARVSAYTSGTIWFFFEPQTITNNTLMLPWTPTVTSGQTLSGWFDASGISELNIQVSAVTTTVVTAQGTDDPTGTTVNTVPVSNDNSANQANTATITTAGKFLVINPSYKWIRLQVTTTGTVLTVQGVVAKYGQNIKLNPNQSTIGLNGGSLAANQSTNVAQIGGTTTVNGGVAGTLGVGGNVAHSGASTANPLQAGGRVVPTTIATQDATLVAGDVSYQPITTGLQIPTKQFSTSELDYTVNFSSISTTTTVQPLVPASGTASVRNYISSLTLSQDAIGAAGLAWILDAAVTVSSIATGTGLCTTSTAHDLKVGDAVVFTALASGTGVSTNTVYYVTSVGSTTTFNFAATIGGSNVVPSVAYTGTTMYRVLYQFRIQTPAIGAPDLLNFPNPLRGIANSALNFLFPSSLTSGTVYLTVTGYRGF